MSSLPQGQPVEKLVEEVRAAREAARKWRAALGKVREEAMGRATLAANQAEEAVREAEDRMLKHVRQETARFFAREVLARELLRMKGEEEELRRRCTELEEDLTELEEDNTRLVEDNIKLVETNTRLVEDNTRIVEDNTRLEEDNIKLVEDNQILEECFQSVRKENEELGKYDLRQILENVDRTSKDLITEQVFDKVKEEEYTEKPGGGVAEVMKAEAEVDDVQLQDMDVEEELATTSSPAHGPQQSRQLTPACARGDGCGLLAAGTCKLFHPGVGVQQPREGGQDGSHLEGRPELGGNGGTDFPNVVDFMNQQFKTADEVESAPMTQDEKMQLVSALDQLQGSRKCRAILIIQHGEPGLMTSNLHNIKQNFETISNSTLGALKAFITQSHGGRWKKIERIERWKNQKMNNKSDYGDGDGTRVAKRKRRKALSDEEREQKRRQQKDQQQLKKIERRKRRLGYAAAGNQPWAQMALNEIRGKEAFLKWEKEQQQQREGEAACGGAMARVSDQQHQQQHEQQQEDQEEEQQQQQQQQQHEELQLLTSHEKKKIKLQLAAARGKTWAVRGLAMFEEMGRRRQVLQRAAGEARGGGAGPGICRAWNQGACENSLCRLDHRCSVVIDSGETCRQAHRAGEHS